MPDLALSSAISVALVCLLTQSQSDAIHCIIWMNFTAMNRYPMNVWNLMGRFTPLHGVSRF